MSDDTTPQQLPTAPITWSMLGTAEFWLFFLVTITSTVALKTPAGLWHDLAITANGIIGAVSAWLVQRAREAASPAQSAIIAEKNRTIGVLASCVIKNHPPTASAACSRCGASVPGKFCGECGAPAPSAVSP